MATVLLDGLGIPESPRWHDGRLWFCNWTTPEIVAVDAAGTPEVMATVDTTVPYSIDWLPDGTLLVVAGRQAQLLRQAPSGELLPTRTSRPTAARSTRSSWTATATRS